MPAFTVGSTSTVGGTDTLQGDPFDWFQQLPDPSFSRYSEWRRRPHLEQQRFVLSEESIDIQLTQNVIRVPDRMVGY